jgi:F-type H+-transporting ATPase subunit delta
MSVSTSYAKALYQAAKDSKINADALSEIESQLGIFALSFETSKEMRVALLGPMTTSKEKVALVEGIANKIGFQPLLSQFLVLLARKGRLSLLGKMKDAFSSIRVTEEGGVIGKLVTAEPLGEADINSLAKAFGQKLGKKVAFQVATDSSLLAGIKVTVNGVTYDGTLRSQIQKLREQFVAGFTGANA